MIYVTKLSELKNLPEEIHEGLVFDFGERNQIITHLKGLKTKIVRGNVDLSRLQNLQTLEGMGSRYFKTIHGTLELPYNIKSHMLSILKVRYLHGFYFISRSFWKPNPIDEKPMNILKKYQTTFDILECQEELIINGYKHQAR
jgi:hypothetical protein